MVIKPVGSRESIQVDIKMASECWNWCQSTWDKGRNSWSDTKQWVRSTLEYIWLLFLALVASENNEQRRASIRDKETVGPAEELIEVQIKKEISVIVDQDEVIQSTAEEVEKVISTSDVSAEEGIDEDKTDIKIDSVENENSLTRASLRRKEFKPLTIVEEDEDSEEDVEEKEKQWRAANGGLARFAAVENLAFRSDSLGNDESLDIDKNEGDQNEGKKSSEGQGDDLWQSLVAKYADGQDFSKEQKEKSDVPSQKMEVKVGVSEEIGQDQMSQEEFSAAVGRRLSEILAMDEAQEIIALKEQPAVEKLEIDADMLEEHDDEIRVLTEENVCKENDGFNEIKVEKDVFETEISNTCEDVNRVELETNSKVAESSLSPNLKTEEPEFENHVLSTNEKEISFDDGTNNNESEASPIWQLKKEVEIEDNETENLIQGHFQEEKTDDYYCTEDKAIAEPLEKETNLDIANQNDFLLVSDHDADEHEDESENEIAVVADFTFKLRPKEKDEISFGLKAEIVKDNSMKITDDDVEAHEESIDKKIIPVNESLLEENSHIVLENAEIMFNSESPKSSKEVKLDDSDMTATNESVTVNDVFTEKHDPIDNNVDQRNKKGKEFSDPEEVGLQVQEADQVEMIADSEIIVAMEEEVATDEHIESSTVYNDLVQPVDNKLVSFLLQEACEEKLDTDSESMLASHIEENEFILAKEEVCEPLFEESFAKADMLDTVRSFELNKAEEGKLPTEEEPNLSAENLEEDLPQTEKCKTRITKNLMKKPVVKDKVKSFHLHEAEVIQSPQEPDANMYCEPVEETLKENEQFPAQLIEESLVSPVIKDEVKSLNLQAAIESEINTKMENKPSPISSKKLSLSKQAEEVAMTLVEESLVKAAEIQPIVSELIPDEGMEISDPSVIPAQNLFSDVVVDETYNIILDKEASMEADDDTSSIKKGILDTTVYEFDSNFDSKDIFDEKEVDDILKANGIDKNGAKSEEFVENKINVPNVLSDVDDFISSDRSLDNKPSLSIDEHMEEDQEWAFSPGLTAEEEAELAELAEIDHDQSEIDFKQYMSMSANLTQQELDELAEFENEKQSAQAIREAERKELEKFLEMPAGLTEQEQAELSDLLAEDLQDAEISQATEERLAAFLAAARAESGFSDGLEDEPLEKYMNLPVGLTEEEERMLREGTDGEVDLLKDEEYREEIRRRFLENLDEDEDMVLLDEYEFTEQYGSDFEFEYDEDYVGEDLTAAELDELKVMGAVPKNMKSDKTFLDETGKTPVAPPRKSKKSDAPKAESSFKNSGSQAGPSKSTKIGDDNKDAKDVKNKKFFRLGALGTKKKKKILNDFEDEAGFHSNYKTVRKKTSVKNLLLQRKDSGYFSSFGSGSMDNLTTITESKISESFTNKPHGLNVEREEMLMTENYSSPKILLNHEIGLFFPLFSFDNSDVTLSLESKYKNIPREIHLSNSDDPREDTNIKGKIERCKKRRKKRKICVKDLVAKFSGGNELENEQRNLKCFLPAPPPLIEPNIKGLIENDKNELYNVAFESVDDNFSRNKISNLSRCGATNDAELKSEPFLISEEEKNSKLEISNPIKEGKCVGDNTDCLTGEKK